MGNLYFINISTIFFFFYIKSSKFEVFILNNSNEIEIL